MVKAVVSEQALFKGDKGTVFLFKTVKSATEVEERGIFFLFIGCS